MEQPLKIKNYDSHFYLYAKHWYKETDTVEDLKIIQGKYCGTNPEYISKNDILQHLTTLVWKHMNEHIFYEFCNNMLPSNTWKFTPKENMKTIEEIMIFNCLSILRLLQTKKDDGTILIELDKPDPNILPLREIR